MPSNSSRKSEMAAETGEEVQRQITLPTVKEAVAGHLADAQAGGLADSSIEKLRQVFEKQLLSFGNSHRVVLLRDFNPRNLTEWRAGWPDKPLAKKKKFERVVSIFWFCVREGWIRDSSTASLGRIITKQVPTDYYTRDENARIVSATYRPDDGLERSWAPEQRGIGIRALTQLMRWSGLRIRDAATLECSRLIDNKLMLYQAKTGYPSSCPCRLWSQTCCARFRPASSPTRATFSGPAMACPRPSLPLEGHRSALHRRRHPPDRTARPSAAIAICSAIPLRSRCFWPGVPIDQVSILLGHSSVRITEKHYSPWVGARQDQPEKSVQAAWQLLLGVGATT